MSKIRVGIVRGGTGLAFENSIKSGGAILQAIREKLNSEYEVVDIFIDKEGFWYIAGRQIDLESLFSKVDILFGVLHDDDNGSVAQIAKELNIPYIGSSAFGSSFSSNKSLAKEKMKSLGIKTAPYCLVTIPSHATLDDANVYAREVFSKIAPPWIIKPNHGACSLHIQIARTLPELALALYHQNQKHNMSLIVETYLYGREVHLGLVENLRGAEHYHSMPIEILKNEKNASSGFLNYKNDPYIKARLSQSERQEIFDIASKAHKDFGLSHFSGFDFILNPKGAHLIEVNDVPEFHEESTFHKSLAESGVSLEELIKHLISNAKMLKK